MQRRLIAFVEQGNPAGKLVLITGDGLAASLEV
jgi:hypothetical protein